MKKVVSLILLAILAISLFSCTTPEDLYGTWYVDEGGIRNVIQFSENAEGKNVAVWAVYNIKEDSIESNNTGYYKISGDKIIFEYGDDTERLELSFTLAEDKLTLANESAIMTLTKYVLEE